MQAWADGATSPAMAPGLLRHHAVTPRGEASRRQAAERLARTTGFSYLTEDDTSASPLDRLGETVTRIVYVGLTTDAEALGYRFYLNASGRVVTFFADN